MAMHDERVNRLLTAIFSAHEDESIDCETCCEQFDCLVELVNSGANMRDILPAVEEHLRCCPDCNEEFQALVSIIRAEARGLLETPGGKPTDRPGR